MADVRAPVFSCDGKILYYAASTNSGPVQFGLDMSSQERPYRAGLYAAVLTADGVSPLAPKPGDESAAKKEEDDKKRDEGKPATRIDFDGLMARTVGLPLAEGNYGQLQVAKDGTLFHLHAVHPGATSEPPGQNAERENRLKRFDFEEREENTAFTGLTRLNISEGGEHMLVRLADNSLAVAKVEKEIKPEALKIGDLRMHIDPRKEWAQIFDEAWNPFLRGPLATPGNEARQGEYLPAINGQQLTARDNLFAHLQQTTGKQVSLRVGPRADGRNARNIVVEPIENEFLLRLWAWVEDNRRKIDAATDGKVGYIYLPNTAGAGCTFFNRMFFAQIDKQAFIIDERPNTTRESPCSGHMALMRLCTRTTSRTSIEWTRVCSLSRLNLRGALKTGVLIEFVRCSSARMKASRTFMRMEK